MIGPSSSQGQRWSEPDFPTNSCGYCLSSGEQTDQGLLTEGRMCDELNVTERGWMDDGQLSQQFLPALIPPPGSHILAQLQGLDQIFSPSVKDTYFCVCPVCPQFLELTLGLGETLVPVLIP